MELSYAPPITANPNSVLYVLAAGIFTSVLALIALHFVQKHTDMDIMSFTVKLILPLGAIIVGLVAGLGYFVGSKMMDVRIHGWLAWTMVLLLVAAYFGALYVEYFGEGVLMNPQTMKRVGFWEYYHLTTTHMTRLSDSSRIPGASPVQPELLGMSGYFYRALGIIGFALGGVLPTLALRVLPYCDLCQRYMRTRTLLRIPAAAPLKKFRVRSGFSLDAPEHRQAMDTGLKILDDLAQAIKSRDIATTQRIIATHRKASTTRFPLLAQLRVQYCVQCRQAVLIGALEAGSNIQTSLARELFREPLDRDTVNQLTNPNAAVAVATDLPNITTAP